MPDVSLLTGFALAALGFALVLRQPARGGVLIGLGAGIGFLSKGLIAPDVIGMRSLVLPVCFKQWRSRADWRGLLLAALVSLPLCVDWPYALYVRSPALSRDWFWDNNIGRFVGFSVWRLRTEHTPWLWTKTIPWFTLPALPLALWTLWRRRRTALAEPCVQYALAAFGVLMLTLAASASAREVYAWPLLIPVSILAAPAAIALPGRAERVWICGSFILFDSLSRMIVCVCVWAWMMVSGAPPRWQVLLHYLPGDFVARFELFRAVLALALVSGAAWVLRATQASAGEGPRCLVVGLTCAWSLFMTLWMPWLDYGKSFRSVYSSMPLPAPSDCLASANLGCLLRCRQEPHALAGCFVREAIGCQQACMRSASRALRR